MPEFNAERAARILADAVVRGNDRKTALAWGITPRTLRNYRERLLTDEKLSAFFRERLDEVELSWRAELVRTMRATLRKARGLLKAETDLDKVTRLAKELGGVGTAREALGVDGPRDHQPSAALPEDPSQALGDAGEDEGEAAH